MRLIDADALIGELHTTYLYDDNARKIIYRKIEEQPTIGWISVKNRLPQHYDRVPVLIKYKDEDMSDKLHFNCLWYVHEPFSNDEEPHWERIGRLEYEVLYWFELPKPPKDGEQNGKL